MTDGRVRWRMTLDELSHRSRSNPTELERWRRLGAFGDRWKEDRDRGPWRHITKVVAHRAIIMRTLLDAGLTEGAAVQVVRGYELKRFPETMDVMFKGGRFQIYLENLKLP